MIWYGIPMLWNAISMLCHEIFKNDMIWYAIVWYGIACYAMKFEQTFLLSQKSSFNFAFFKL